LHQALISVQFRSSKSLQLESQPDPAVPSTSRQPNTACREPHENKCRRCLQCCTITTKQSSIKSYLWCFETVRKGQEGADQELPWRGWRQRSKKCQNQQQQQQTTSFQNAPVFWSLLGAWNRHFCLLYSWWSWWHMYIKLANTYFIKRIVLYCRIVCHYLGAVSC